MPTIRFTAALKRFFPDLVDQEVSGNTVKDILVQVNQRYPGIQSYLIEETGGLRKHINIFVRGELITDRSGLQDELGAQDEVVIFQALSGG
ncbi:MAG: MoaD/ThiS family protein [Cyclobacteriaceae bacterium]|jgi:molybdopterin converting factor small subunit|nr:molybdenum cofactor biosynthesis protein MoaD [Cytophagales bacterium]HNP77238.1 MoaD/ThiS family protein [Cyclobacteriaceae bacterium]